MWTPASPRRIAQKMNSGRTTQLVIPENPANLRGKWQRMDGRLAESHELSLTGVISTVPRSLKMIRRLALSANSIAFELTELYHNRTYPVNLHLIPNMPKLATFRA